MSDTIVITGCVKIGVMELRRVTLGSRPAGTTKEKHDHYDENCSMAILGGVPKSSLFPTQATCGGGGGGGGGMLRRVHIDYHSIST